MKKLFGLLKKGNSENPNTQEEKFLPTSKEALERTKKPQLISCINAINAAMERGFSHTYIGEEEKLHQETIDYITGKGYDIRTTCFKQNDRGFRTRDEYYNEAFWHEGTTGKYFFYEEK